MFNYPSNQRYILNHLGEVKMKTPQYEDKEILMAHIIEKDMINIPTYQRSLVWKMKRKEAFIRNVLEGEPFGIVLVKENNKMNEETGEIEHMT